MTVYILKDSYNNDVIGVFLDYTNAYNKGVEIFGGIEEDFDIDAFDVE